MDTPPDQTGQQTTTPQKFYPVPSYPDIHLPPTLDWYRQAANWLVGLATGALAVGLSSTDSIPFDTTGQQWVASLCIGFFLLTVGSGIAFYFWITSFANCLEQRDKFAAWHQAEQNLDQKKTYLDKHTKVDNGLAKANARYSFFYGTMMYSFLAAVLFMVLTLVGILRADPTPRPKKLAVFRANQHTFLFDENGGTTWLLTTDTANHLIWQPVTIPITATATSATAN